MNSQKFSLSIITINKNNREGLRKTIESILAQTNKNFEWIIIDGDSTDGSKELLENYKDYIDIWISEPDTGIFNAMNKGINLSHGNYIYFLNSGDYFEDENLINKILPFLKGKDFYAGDIKTAKGRMDVNIHDNYALIYQLFKFTIPHQGIFTNRECFQKYGLYEEKYLAIADWVFLVNSLLLKNAEIEKIPLTIAFFDTSGISSDEALCWREKLNFNDESPRLKVLVEFYVKYVNIFLGLKKIGLLRRLGIWLGEYMTKKSVKSHFRQSDRLL